MKKQILSVVVITVLWKIFDYIFHCKLLHTEYMNTDSLWRSMEDVNQIYTLISSFLLALVFTVIYQRLIVNKSQETGLQTGLWVGILVGLGMASSYLWMPISIKMALVWFIASIVQYGVAGAVVGKWIEDE